MSLSEFHLNINSSKTKPFQEPIPSVLSFPKFFLYFQKLSYIHSCLPTNLKVTPWSAVKTTLIFHCAVVGINPNFAYTVYLGCYFQKWIFGGCLASDLQNPASGLHSSSCHLLEVIHRLDINIWARSWRFWPLKISKLGIKLIMEAIMEHELTNVLVISSMIYICINHLLKRLIDSDGSQLILSNKTQRSTRAEDQIQSIFDLFKEK